MGGRIRPIVPPPPGLTFAGLPWQHTMGSANLIALLEGAEYLAARW